MLKYLIIGAGVTAFAVAISVSITFGIFGIGFNNPSFLNAVVLLTIIFLIFGLIISLIENKQQG